MEVMRLQKVDLVIPHQFIDLKICLINLISTPNRNGAHSFQPQYLQENFLTH